jgi:4-amino-4-deoxy-L-arabinose transferase-like glycosyltransferase
MTTSGKRGLAALLALYLALAAGFAAVTPFGRAPDETAHALYVEHLVRERSLPVLRREQRGAYEFHQPPLYYLLAAPAWAVAPNSPAARKAARGVSILLGVVGIALIAALASVGWPGNDALALGSAGFAALLPMRLATAASVSNDTLAEAIFTAALLAMAILLRRGADLRRSAMLGLCLGLGVLSKSSDMVLFPVALVALLLACRGGDGSQQTGAGSKGSRAGSRPEPAALDGGLFVRCAAVTFGVALLVGGGWMARNARLYGDPLGTRAFEQYFQDTPTPAQMEQLLGYSGLELLQKKVLPLTFDSFWGVFGHMELFMGAYEKGARAPGWAYVLADRGYPPPSWVYPLLLIPTLIAAGGLFKLGVQAFRRSGVQGRQGQPLASERLNARTPERLVGVLSLSAFLAVAAFLRFNTEFFQAQGRYLFPAMGPIALGFAVGWLAWWPERRRRWGVLLLLGGMLALALFALFGTVAPGLR